MTIFYNNSLPNLNSLTIYNQSFTVSYNNSFPVLSQVNLTSVPIDSMNITNINFNQSKITNMTLINNTFNSSIGLNLKNYTNLQQLTISKQLLI
jgi:hypothetical protein